MVDKIAPSGSQEMATRSSSVDVPKLPNLTVNILGKNSLERGVSGIIEGRKDGLGAVARDGKAAAIVSIGLCQSLGKGCGFVGEVGVVGVGRMRVVVILGGVADGEQANVGINLVGVGICHEFDMDNSTENVGGNTGESPKINSGVGVFGMTLREIEYL